MKDLLTYIFYAIGQKERAKIDEADSNPDKWYELFITHEDGSTESVESADTFAEIIQYVEQYALEYKFDRINIDIWENREFPNNISAFFTTPLIYNLIHEHFKHQNELKNMRFVGEIIIPEDDSTPKFRKAVYNYGEIAGIFIDEIAFEYFNDLICYIPDLGDEDVAEDGCTYKYFLEVTEGNKELARNLFDMVTWEYPSTLYDQWEIHGVLDEEELDEEGCASRIEKLVLFRFKTFEELKEKVTSLIGMEVISIEEDDMSCRDDKSTGFIQPDFSMTLDIDTNSEEFPDAMLTMFYYKDRQDNYVIVETSFAFE